LDLLSARQETRRHRLELRPKAAQHKGMTVNRVVDELSPDQLLDLIERVALDSDRAAFVELFRHFAPRVKSYLRGMKADEGLAEDLTQEVMLTVWRRAKQYDARQASLSTWIFTIARNRRIDAVRREKRPEIDPNDPALVPDGEEAPEELVSRQQQNAALREAIVGLPSEQAQLLRLSYFEEKSHAEIAGELDLPLGTVKSRLRLAIGKLRGILEDE
jgi:RNA polymerase sigma factor (sigma-70 family)